MSPPCTLPFDHTVSPSTGSPTSSSMDATQLINFLREYRVLECSCCSTAFGFQHKATGLLYCVQGCHETSPGSPLLSQSPNLVVSTYSPPIAPMKVNTLVPTIPNGIYVGNGAAVPRVVADAQKTASKPPVTVTSMEPSVTEVVNPLSSAPKIITPELPAQTKIERTESTPAPVMPLPIKDVQQNKPATEKASSAVVNAAAAQPQQLKTNINVPAPAPSTSTAPRLGADVTDARLGETKSAGLKSVRVKPNSDVELSRANIPWPDVGNSAEPIVCSLGFDCGDGSFFVQLTTPAFIKFAARVGSKIVEVIRSGKCKQLTHPAVGSLCLAPFEGEHYRAEIIAREADGKWRVFFIDYGNTEIMGDLDLLGIPDELKEEPRLCIFGYWDQVLAGTKKADQLFETCFDAETETMPVTFWKKIANGQYVFQIGEPAKATFIVEPSSTPSQPKSPRVPQWRDCTYSANLKSNKAVHIVHIWDATTFQVIADEDEGALTAFQALIKTFASKDDVIRLTRPPVLNEIVIALYQGEYYRAKVDSVDGNNCTCNFLDYGDSKVSNVSDVIPVDDTIMKYPIYGMTVRLDKVPAQPEGFTLDETLGDLVYNYPYILDLVQNANIKPADQSSYVARLWDTKKENTLNDAVNAALHALKNNEQEIAYLSTDQFFRDTKAMVEAYMKEHNGDPCVPYVFKLDNADYPYKVADLPLLPLSHVVDVFEVEITQFKSISNVIGRPTGEIFKQKLENLSEKISDWIKSASWSPQDMRFFTSSENDFHDQLCLVKWPQWEEVNYVMELLQQEWWKRNFEDMRLDIFSDDFAVHTGKWFRAACKYVYYYHIDGKKKAPLMYE
ncbi:unnamed protein product [Orchesella dallaii]